MVTNATRGSIDGSGLIVGILTICWPVQHAIYVPRRLQVGLWPSATSIDNVPGAIRSGPNDAADRARRVGAIGDGRLDSGNRGRGVALSFLPQHAPTLRRRHARHADGS